MTMCNEKPLEFIMQKTTRSSIIVHHPGTETPVAETLSRKSLSDSESNLADGMDIQVLVYSNLPANETKLKEITAKDQERLATEAADGNYQKRIA